LLGRHGDVFRIGSAFFNYAKFAEILSDDLMYSGELQIVLRPAGKTRNEELCICVSRDDELDSHRVRNLILDNYADLRQCVAEEGVLELSVQMVAADRFQRTEGSGKLKRIVDERTLSKKS
jgi:phenylacetate-coenzyme A ligase PaaK-like adenylate-forming protein